MIRCYANRAIIIAMIVGKFLTSQSRNACQLLASPPSFVYFANCRFATNAKTFGFFSSDAKHYLPFAFFCSAVASATF